AAACSNSRRSIGPAFHAVQPVTSERPEPDAGATRRDGAQEHAIDPVRGLRHEAMVGDPPGGPGPSRPLRDRAEACLTDAWSPSPTCWCRILSEAYGDVVSSPRQ